MMSGAFLCLRLYWITSLSRHSSSSSFSAFSASLVSAGFSAAVKPHMQYERESILIWAVQAMFHARLCCVAKILHKNIHRRTLDNFQLSRQIFTFPSSSPHATMLRCLCWGWRASSSDAVALSRSEPPTEWSMLTHLLAKASTISSNNRTYFGLKLRHCTGHTASLSRKIATGLARSSCKSKTYTPPSFCVGGKWWSERLMGSSNAVHPICLLDSTWAAQANTSGRNRDHLMSNK